MKNTFVLLVLLVAAPVFASEPLGKNCQSGFKDWCSGLVEGGCWHCSHDTLEDCQKAVRNSSEEICVHRSNAK